MSKPERVNLRRFFGGYFHQDWRSDASDFNGVVDRYVEDFPDKGKLLALAEEMDALSNAYATDAELETELIAQLECDGFTPSLAGLSARLWIRELADRLRSASATS